MFLNDNDRKMYELLYVLRNGTPEELAEYIDSLPPIPEEWQQQYRDKHKNQSREEQTAEIVELLDKMQEHLTRTYFTRSEEPCRI